MSGKIVVSGATGVIGTALICYALERNIEVLAICHKGSKKIHFLPHSTSLHILELNLQEYNNFTKNRKALESLPVYDCFFHLAWRGTTGIDRIDIDMQLKNIQYTLDAVELASALGCKCFVGAGSQAEYGRFEGMLSSKTPAFPENGYGISKLCAGQLSRIRCEQFNIKHIWTRILSVYGPGDNENSLIMTAISSFCKRTKTEFTAGMQKWDYIYSRDAARILLGLAELGEHGNVYCVGSGKTRLLKDYIHQIYKVINGQDSSDNNLGIGSRPYADKQVMYLQANTAEWPMELKLSFEEKPMYSFPKGIKYTIDWFYNNTK